MKISVGRYMYALCMLLILSCYSIVMASGLSAILAFNIETSGRSFTKNGIVSIGASLQDFDSHERGRFQCNISLPENCCYEERCVSESFLENPKTFEFVQAINCAPPADAMKILCDFLDEVERVHSNVIIVSDNPSFDIAWINVYLDKYTNRPPLAYTKNDKCRLVYDATILLEGVHILNNSNSLVKYGLLKGSALKSNWERDGSSLNNARIIADLYNQAQKQLCLTMKGFSLSSEISSFFMSLHTSFNLNNALIFFWKNTKSKFY